MHKEELKELTREHLGEVIERLNSALAGQELDKLEATIIRLGRGKLPHWFSGLKENGTLPNADGKTVGSILEMLFVAVLEWKIRVELRRDIPALKINPARGVDLPDLDLGIKSPSENFCTSEPFFTAYERLYGSEFDALVFLTDYQDAKGKQTLKLKVKEWKYLRKTEIADSKLCDFAQRHREWILKDVQGEIYLQKMYRFLAYVNQSDWRAAQILKLIDKLDDEKSVKALIASSVKDFEKKNEEREQDGILLLQESERNALTEILKENTLWKAIINAGDNWVFEVLKDAARAPSSAEWMRLLNSPLDGKIGMSFALQWRYNFAKVFKPSNPKKRFNQIKLLEETGVSSQLDLGMVC